MAPAAALFSGSALAVIRPRRMRLDAKNGEAMMTRSPRLGGPPESFRRQPSHPSPGSIRHDHCRLGAGVWGAIRNGPPVQRAIQRCGLLVGRVLAWLVRLLEAHLAFLETVVFNTAPPRRRI